VPPRSLAGSSSDDGLLAARGRWQCQAQAASACPAGPTLLPGMAAAAGDAQRRCDVLLAHAKEACDRKRVRCASRTTWSHENLCAYVGSALPRGWRVMGPGAPVDDCSNSPSQFPPDVERGAEELRALFLAEGVAATVIDGLDLCAAVCPRRPSPSAPPGPD
jgi:hypothetical protein